MHEVVPLEKGEALGREDWYRKTSWSHADQEAFHARLRRSRGAFHKAQYTRIQASYLENTGEPNLIRSALELLEKILVEWPEQSQLAMVYLQKATSYVRIGELDSAANNFRNAIEAEKQFPNLKTGVYREFAWFVATNNIENLYCEALINLESNQGDLVFPIDVFKVCGAKALILEAEGNQDEAAQYANYAIDAAYRKESGFSYHKTLGLVGDEYKGIVERLQRLIAP